MLNYSQKGLLYQQSLLIMVEKPPQLYVHVMRRELISHTYSMLFLKRFLKYEIPYLESFVPLKTFSKPWEMLQSEV